MGEHQEEQFDIVIVGGGIAGLTAAAYGVKSGAKTLLIERQEHTGGYLGTFTRDGVSFDHGTRALEDSGSLFALLNDLGIQDELTFIKNPVSTCVCGTFFPLKTDEDAVNFFRSLITWFPHEEKGLMALSDKVDTMITEARGMYASENPLFLPPRKSLMKVLPWILKNFRLLRRLSDINDPYRRPAEDLIGRYVSDPALMEVITRPFFARTPAFFLLTYGRLYQDYYYPLGGVGQFPRAIEGLFTRSGGTLRTGTTVSTITPKQHPSERITITLATGEVIRTRTCVIACDPNIFPDLFPTYGASLPGESVITLFATVDLDPNELCPFEYPHFIHIPDTETLPGYLDSCDLREFLLHTGLEVSIPALRDPSLAPPGKTGIILSTPAMMQSGGVDWETLSDEAYEKAKQIAAEALLTAAESVMPRLADRSLVSWSSVSTPRTLKKLTGNSGGSITGFSYLNDPFPGMVDYFGLTKAVKTPYLDIFKAGQWTFSPTGVPVSLITGKLAADGAVRRVRRSIGKK